MCATEEYFCSVNVLFLVLRHSFRYFRSWEDTDLPQVQNGEVTHVRSQCYLFFYHEPLKEKGAGADIKKHTTTRKQHSPLPKLGKSFKRADPLFAFPSTGHLPNVHKGNCVTRHGLAARFSKGDLLELSLILEAECLFSLIRRAAPIKTPGKEAGITGSRLLLSRSGVIVERFLLGNFKAGLHPFMLKSYLLQGLLEDIMFPSASYFPHS